MFIVRDVAATEIQDMSRDKELIRSCSEDEKNTRAYKAAYAPRVYIVEQIRELTK